MPQFDLESARNILNGITPEPWIVATEPEMDADYEYADKLVGGYTGREIYDQELGVFHPKDIKRRIGEDLYEDDTELVSLIRPEQEADAKFIASVRSLYPAALDEIDRLNRRNDSNRNLASLAYGLLQEQKAMLNELYGHCNALRSRAQKAESRILELEATLAEKSNGGNNTTKDK